MIETYIKMAAIFWSLVNVASADLMFLLYRTQRQKAYLMYAFSCILKALWGFTVPGLNIEIVKIINSIVIPPLASFLFFAATYTLINAKAKKGV